MHSARIGIEYVPISRLKEWKHNPRFIGDEQYHALAESVRKFGIIDPLIVDQGYRIVGGHQRLKALRDLGIRKAPVVKLALSSRDFKTLNLALNKISGEWDNELLAPLLEELAPLPEFDLTGFSQQEANVLIETFRLEDGTQADDAPALPKKPKSRLGDMYKLGNNRLLCADATIPESWERLLAGKKASMVITDPPYGVNYELSNKFALNKLTGRKEHDKSWGKIAQDTDCNAALNALPHIFGNLAEDGVTYITSGTRLLISIANWLDTQRIRYAPFLIWDKGFAVITWERYHAAHEFLIYCGPGSYPTKSNGNARSRWFGPKNETTIWRIPIEPSKQRLHPTQKPVALYERAMINSSAQSEIVVDPFAGSGTCIIAAEKRDRRAYCIELDPKYVDVAVKRWENFTGRKAERIRST